MNQFLSHRTTLLALTFSALLLCAGSARATEISGTISSTMTIMEDSELVGDVTCMVTGAPCITFGAPGITLRLNGFTITGPADPLNPATGCTSTTVFAPEDGIDVQQDGVAILGPGHIQNFRRWGILLGYFPLGSNPLIRHVAVKHVTISETCFSGMQTSGITDSKIERNIFARDAGGSDGFSCGGT
jgi:hypothetical protein